MFKLLEAAGGEGSTRPEGGTPAVGVGIVRHAVCLMILIELSACRDLRGAC